MFETPEHIFIIQELCTGGNLLDVIRAEAPMNEKRAAALFRGMIKAVLHCHQVRMHALHRRAGNTASFDARLVKQFF